MDMDDNSSTAVAGQQRWRLIALASAAVTALSLIVVFIVAFLARQDLDTHYNLYYLLWKAGLRRYEPAVALGGLFHDHSYRARYVGMPIVEFLQIFPNTFYKVRNVPPVIKSNEELYITDYARSVSDSMYDGAGWEVTVRDGHVVEFDFGKG